MVALIISTVYRSNLKAMLILPKVNLPFTTVSEFLQTDIPLFIIEGSLADHFTKVRGTFELVGMFGLGKTQCLYIINTVTFTI